MAGLGGRIFLLEVMENVAHTQAVAAYLVGVGGTDALAGGAYLGIALGRLVGSIEHPMGGQDEMGFLRDVETLLQGMAGGFEGFGFGLEQRRVEHHAVADDVHLVALEDSGRYGTEHIFLSFEFKGMSRIGTSLETGNDIVAGSQYVNDFPLAFIAPL